MIEHDELESNNPQMPGRVASANPKAGVPRVDPVGVGLGAFGVGGAPRAVGGAIAGPDGAAGGAPIGAVVREFASDRQPAVDQIRVRAYEISLARNGGPGDARTDWTQAEQELTARRDAVR